jgi:TetR/AcrR family transcriptional regulator, lmrAB and yxaGH operons repressor
MAAIGRSSRDRIIEATGELLELQGYHGTGLNQILQTSHAPKGSLYHHFPGGKDELTVTALQEAGGVVLSSINGALEGDEPGWKVIPDFIGRIAAGVVESGFRAGGPVTAVALETASTNPVIRDVCSRVYLTWREAFARRLERDGFSPPESNRLAQMIVAGIEGGIVLSRCDRDPEPLRAVAEQMRLMLRARAEALHVVSGRRKR